MRGGVRCKVACGICPWNVELFFFPFSQRCQAKRVCLSACCSQKWSRMEETEILMVDWFGNFQPGLLYETSLLLNVFFHPLILGKILSNTHYSHQLTLTGWTALWQIIGSWKKCQLKVVSRATIILTAVLCVEPYIWDLFRIIDFIIEN